VPSLDRSDPPYMQIADQIRQRIITGELRDGDTIPSARQIMQQWGVAMATATKVLAALRSEGYARGVPGVGTVVSSAGQGHAGPDRARSARRGRIYPPDQHAKIQSAELIPADPAIADALGIEAGAQVIRRQRVTYGSEGPVSASTSWFDGGLAVAAPRLLEPERIIEGTTSLISEATGRVVTAGRDKVTARAATTEDAEALGVPAGSPVLAGRTWWADANGDVIEYGEHVTIPGRWSTYEYEVTPQ